MKKLIICGFFIFSSLLMVMQEKGLVGYWNFDEIKEGIVKDLSFRNNDGKIVGAKEVEGISGKALFFDGNSYIDCGTGADFVFTGDYSIELWVKHSSVDSQIYVSKWTGSSYESFWWIGYYEGVVQFADYYTLGIGRRIKGYQIADDKWHYIVGVKEGGNISLYIDGENVGEGKSSEGILGRNDAPLTIGCYGKTRGWRFKGIIDEVKIYNRALSEEEIKKKYFSLSGKKEEPIKIEKVIIEDFEERGKEEFKPTLSRGCSFELTSDFVLSGKKNARFIVTNENIDISQPPYFVIPLSLNDWTKYNSLKFFILSIPSDIVPETGILIQLHSIDFDNVSWLDPNQVSNFWFNIPSGKPVMVSIPLKNIMFKKKIGELLICTTTNPGIYLLDKIELSTENVKDIMVKEIDLPDNLNFEWVDISLKQEECFYFKNIFCYKSDKPLFICLELKNPQKEKVEKEIKVFDEDGKKDIVKTKLIFDKKELKKEIPIFLKGNTKLKIIIDGEEKKVSLMDIKEIREENLKIREERKKQGNPFYRGIISPYWGMIYTKDGIPDIDKMIERLKALGVNCYAYLIAYRSEKELEKLPEFCKKARDENIEVWVYLVPPSEAPINRFKPIEERKYPPYDMDYLKWVEKIAQISLENPNLTLLMIDDFAHDLKFFTIDYTKKIYEKIKTINPKLLFGVCVYYEEIENFVKRGYIPYFDAVLWGYQHNSRIEPECGLSAKSLSIQINKYYKMCPDKIIIPCIYFQPHSSWPKGRPTEEYLKEALKISFEEAGICWIFVTPLPGEFKYDLIKNFTNSVILKKWEGK